MKPNSNIHACFEESFKIVYAKNEKKESHTSVIDLRKVAEIFCKSLRSTIK